MCKIPDGFRWSFSKLTEYEQCPMAFKLNHIDHVENENNAFAEYGTLCHELLEGWAKDEIPFFALSEEYDKRYDTAITHYFPPFPKGMSMKYYQQGKEYFDHFDGFGEEWEVLTAEEKFELDIEGYTFVGIADLTLKNKKTGEIIVIDHKSKSKNSMNRELETYRKQLYIYAAFVKQKFGVFPTHLQFNMFKEGYIIDEVFDEQKYWDTMKWVVDSIHKIEQETEWKVCPSSYFCRYICGVANSCEALPAILNGSYKKKKKEE